MGVEKKVGKWGFEGNAELRSKDNASVIDRWSLGVGASFRIVKPVTIGIGYDYISYHDVKYNDCQPRQRYLVYLQGSQKMGNFTLSLRERFQRTIKDESDRILASGGCDTYQINPEFVWRNRLRLSYDIPQCRIKPSFAVESFCQLNNPDGNRFNKLRNVLSFEYKLAKHHKVELFGQMDHQLNTESPLTRFVTGMGYIFAF